MPAAGGGSLRARLQELLPRVVLAPSFAAVLIFVYGFILFTAYLSITNSRSCRASALVGLEDTRSCSRCRTGGSRSRTSRSSAACTSRSAPRWGLLLAILLDQKIRAEGVLLPIYLYPMALSFIVTGTAWKWFLDPGIGVEQVVRSWGFDSFQFGWIKVRDWRSIAS